ncbi:tyrosine-type recombinase/integrase [Magnetovirga frankeli]|uniref:site-specific integrase n=1 Tax=Magnetovirga frankeli TaxID=947516 RepID=UPI001293F45A|nr:tyrosine-type recombinase/integrase [gamma proteobacterium SS-5]
MKAHLTQKLIDTGLFCPEGKKRVEITDATYSSGMYVEVRHTSPGQGTFYLRYKDSSGKTCHQRIGRTTELSLTDARKRTLELKAEIAKGANPREEEKARKAVLIFGEFFTDHYMPYALGRKRSAAKDQEMFDLRLSKAIGHLRLNQITRQQIVQFQNQLKAEGLKNSSNNRYVGLIRRVLNLAVEWGMLESSPATKIGLLREDNQVEHYLNDSQMAKLLEVLRSHPNRPVCSILQFLLASGVRLNEALTAQWKYIDRNQRTLTIPAAIAKGKRVRSVPLNDAAMAILDQQGTEGQHTYVFVNPKSKSHYTTIQKVWERIRAKAGLEHLRIHDLRHNHASILVNAGRTLYEVQQVLGHADPRVSQRYAHLSTKTLQEASATVSQVLTGHQ